MQARLKKGGDLKVAYIVFDKFTGLPILDENGRAICFYAYEEARKEAEKEQMAIVLDIGEPLLGEPLR